MKIIKIIITTILFIEKGCKNEVKSIKSSSFLDLYGKYVRMTFFYLPTYLRFQGSIL